MFKKGRLIYAVLDAYNGIQLNLNNDAQNTIEMGCSQCEAGYQSMGAPDQNNAFYKYLSSACGHVCFAGMAT